MARTARPSPSPPSSPRRTRRRGPGRPRARGVDQRARLLDAAARVFAERGVEAATLREIATRAGASAALVAYYFGSKPRLLAALLDERVAPVFADATAPLLAARERGELALEAVVRAYTHTLWTNPWLPPLLAREVLSEGGALRESFLERFAGPVAGLVPALIERAQRGGRLRRDLDPQLIALSLISLLVFPMVAAPVWRHALGITVDDAFPERLSRHTIAVLRHGIEVGHG
jgi:AcrR family transcriptional regulator